MGTVTKTQSEESAEPMDQNATVEVTLRSEDGDHFLSRLRLLWDKRRFLAKAATAGLLAGTLLAFLIPRRFESTAQLMPPDSQSLSGLAMLAGLSGGAAGGAGGLGMLAGDLLGIKSNGALFVGVLRSRTAADHIVDRFDLKKVYGESLQIKAREKLAERTAITEDRKSGIIIITVTDHDPKRAAAMAAAYVEELNTLVAQLSTSSARRERIFLEGRLDAVKQNLEAAEKDFSQFASNKGAIDITAQGKAMVEATAVLGGQLIAAQSELEGLKQIFADNNVRVRSLQARVNELQQQLRRLGGKAEGSTETASDSDAAYPTLRQLPILGVPYADKMRRLKVEEVVFETLTKQYELAKVQEAKEIPSVKVLDVPVIPEHKTFPPRLVIIILATLFSAMVGMAWLLGHARWQGIDPQAPGKVFAQEVFHTVAARIPWISRNGAGESVPETETNKKEDNKPTAKSADAGF